MDLGGNRVHSVQHKVIIGHVKPRFDIVGDKGFDRRDLAFRADVPVARRRRGDLIQPEGGIQRDELTIEIGRRDHITIDDGEMPDARANQRFSGIGSHTADTEEQDTRVIQFF